MSLFQIQFQRQRVPHRAHRDGLRLHALLHDLPRVRHRDVLHDRRVHQEAQHERECRRLCCCRCKKGRHNPSRRSLKGPVDERSTRSQS